MCVKIFVEWAKPAKRFEKLAADIEGQLLVEFFLEAGSLNEPTAVSIARKGAVCGCSFVETPRGSASIWQLKPQSAEALAGAVAMLEATLPLKFRLGWLGPDQPEPSREDLPLSALLSRLRAGQLVPGRDYAISTAANSALQPTPTAASSS